MAGAVIERISFAAWTCIAPLISDGCGSILGALFITTTLTRVSIVLKKRMGQPSGKTPRRDLLAGT